uniref:Uncharacterized protein n=1 Tax=Anguilla anguilla TaxID=7936 RepID=A0A0E9SUH8_ANGAN
MKLHHWSAELRSHTIGRITCVLGPTIY